MTISKALTFDCDVTDCDASETLFIAPGEPDVRCPKNWMTDLSHRFFACSSEHATAINNAHLDKTGKRLLWLTYREAALTTDSPRKRCLHSAQSWTKKGERMWCDDCEDWVP